MSRTIFADFDHYRLPIGEDGTPIDAVRQVRDEAVETDTWIGWCENYGGFWLVAGWDEARMIYRDSRTFSNRIPITPPFLNITGRPIMLVGYDGEEHMRYRRIVQAWFSPQNVATMTEEFRSDAEELIDGFIDAGSADLGRDFGWVIPQRLVARMMGMPIQDAAELTPWVYALSHAEGLGLANVAEARSALSERFHDLLRDRRRRPGSDILSLLVQYRDPDGRALTEDELLDYFSALVDGAIENSSQLLSDTAWLLAREHDLRRRLAADPDLLATSFDEFLRYFSPANGGSRLVTADTTVGGQHLAAGEVVFPYTPAVNRDPRQFSDPDAFVPDRSPNRHFALSNGPHRCLGAHLIRLEFVVATSVLLRRIPDFELDPAAHPHWSLGGTSGMESVPVVFQLGRKAA